MAVGVGVALAKAGLDRRTARQHRRNRQLGLAPGERLADALPRMALGQVDLALELLTSDDGALNAKAVHETRKALKRLRALLRLVRQQLGEQQFQRENDALRNAAQRLSSARDAEVMLATLDALLARHPRKLGRRRDVLKLRKRLLAEQQRVQHLTRSHPATRNALLAELNAFRTRVAAWTLADRPSIALVERDLAQLYRQGQKRHLRVLRGKRQQTIAMHQWRKRVKDLRYAAEILQRRNASERRSPDKRLRKVARRADLLSELLGEEHDLALLAQHLRNSKRVRSHANRKQTQRAVRQQTWRTPPKTRKALLKAIAKRRRELRKRALRDGARLYRRSPNKLLRQLS
jgi:CHAD domain-containing protein